MAKFTHVIHGDFDRVLRTIEKGVMDASVSATFLRRYIHGNRESRSCRRRCGIWCSIQRTV